MIEKYINFHQKKRKEKYINRIKHDAKKDATD